MHRPFTPCYIITHAAYLCAIFDFKNYLGAEEESAVVTLEEEKRFILLTATLLRGGTGTKGEVLDEVDHSLLIKLTDREKESKQNRPEAVWRNDLAFVRKHLVESGYFNGNIRNRWTITDAGREYFSHLFEKVNAEQNLAKVTSRCLEIARQQLKGAAHSFQPMPDETVRHKYTEGSVKQVYVNRYERDANARAECIAHYGATCIICGFNFNVIYGEEVAGFIHVHHLKPLSEINEEYVVDPIKDLRPVCPNCHAVIHLGKRTRSIEEVKALINRRVPR